MKRAVGHLFGRPPFKEVNHTNKDIMEGNSSGLLFGDGSHILYVNGKYKGDDEIGKLMYDFSCTEPDDMNYEELAKKARYFKQDERGDNGGFRKSV